MQHKQRRIFDSVREKMGSAVREERNEQRKKSRSNVQVLLGDLKACRNLGKGKQLHADAVKSGQSSSIYVATALVNMYAKCRSMSDARQVFDSTQHLDVVSWTALILGYADNGEGVVALHMFSRMSCSPNSWTLVAALKACSLLAERERTDCRNRVEALHNLASEYGCDSNTFVQNSLIDMYAKCGRMMDAREVFDNMKYPEVVSWNVLILGYAENEEGLTALHMFSRMRSQAYLPDSWTFVAALKACSSLSLKQEFVECRNRGKQVHELASQSGCSSDIYVLSTLIDMYAKCRSMVEALQVFNSMRNPDVVSWTALILGYADNGEGRTALDMFTRMRSEGCMPDSLAYSAVLKACGLLGALEFGRKIHQEISTRIQHNLNLATCVVDFYAKCGSLLEARKVFNSLKKTKDLTMMNALLAGYGRLGDIKAVFGLFEEMQDVGFQPDGVTFLALLSCCSHAGVVEKAVEIFEEMSSTYGITPTIEHYNCMVDILGRSNKLEDAVSLLQNIPCRVTAVTWQTVLGACRKWKNVEIGRVAFESLIRLDERNAAAYVLMAHIYGSRGMWEEEEMVVGMRMKLKALKNPEESWWTNEVGEVHSFTVGDRKHGQIYEIEEKVKAMIVRMREEGGYIGEKEEEASCGHSEKFAIACALINTEPGETIRIGKNMRSCDDCHTATALISKVERRSVICKDANRFHIFKDGKCSCDDFW